ncbi:tRNA-Thr(GGU) m(6)t(6)A37 methyltransferase TsaA [Desulfatibacillum alkenivorans DSM 16219]|jgi:tRNA-Thr(GGU) m(6)t(6)A37 methyltransferase TsaA|uniref:tRNA-Thr(GGU) m(6)t(6)A37 methyltransferase TsaA n=1 Tax=Desulfatibacillum alkenivorans DSM 16219 TaxID=1121393 RepID=A0A1M6E328_9BACT|nr:tRNA (N6-threonylcarbamoyladenosine(37)-N6)-methyltransferase TrmO [Desulfatibacillum alkenivorans]SHI79805.1 tRNA-Thr(GGU) m(6)t(6)A37 methyltransferase TsaA [Desulfatibacillum alkenivorans DSM 16219]
MAVVFEPIGVVHTLEKKMPRHCSISDVEGTLEIKRELQAGLDDVKAGDRIVVLFHFHKSPAFSPELLHQTPPHGPKAKGVFSICSPVRPNAIGMSMLSVLDVQGNVIHVKGLDMMDGTPILDIKPVVTGGPD